MKLPKEITNGILIFFGLAAYFLLMQALGLSDNHLLRFFNIFIVYFGVYKTLKSNFNEGKMGYIYNTVSTGFTAINGVVLSFIGLVLYIYTNGGQAFLNNLSPGFLFSGNPTVTEYCFGLLFEGMASAIVIVFISMQYWRNKTALND
jgi:hypothetical protein